MSRVFIDSNFFIYLIEDSGKRGKLAESLLLRLSARQDEVITSSLTLGEVLAKPYREGMLALARQYEDVLMDPAITIHSFDLDAARRYAQIRIDRSIKAPDAMQLAVAAAAQCDLFVTNDIDLTRKIVSGVPFIVPFERVPI